MGIMKEHTDIIVRPIVSEKSMAAAREKKYIFEVAMNANKIEIKKAAEAMFGVEVGRVTTLIMKPKPKTVGVHRGKTGKWKKAHVTLTEKSKTIEFFDGLM